MVIARAVMMLHHARSGNAQRADEYADEIQLLHRLNYEHDKYGSWLEKNPYTDCTTKRILTLEAWGDLLMHHHLAKRDTDHFRKYRESDLMDNPIYERARAI